MVNRALMTMQDRVNALIDSRPAYWQANALFVGSLEYLSLGDGVEKLKARLRNLKQHHRLTHEETTQVKHMSLGLASVSRPTGLRRHV